MNLHHPLSPYRYPALHVNPIPRDRRWLRSTAIGATCFVAGIVATVAGIKVAEMVADQELGWMARVEHRRTDPFVGVQVQEPSPVTLREPPPSVTDAARDSLLTDPERSKYLLLPRVASGFGTADEARVLRAACEGLKDRPCLDLLNAR